jgi:alpha-glucosidase (family GH31 glycosyl hydrolase)
VLSVLSWNFYNEAFTSIDNQSMHDQSILITPVLASFFRVSQGVLPDVPNMRWYDEYTL